MFDLVGNPNCWFCHAQAHILYTVYEYSSPSLLIHIHTLHISAGMDLLIGGAETL